MGDSAFNFAMEYHAARERNMKQEKREREERDRATRGAQLRALMKEAGERHRAELESFGGMGMFSQGVELADYVEAPSYKTNKHFKYHVVADRYLVCHDDTTYRTPGNELRPNMRYDLTQSEYEGLQTIKNDWSYIANTDRRIDREIVLGLAKKLWPNVEIVFSDEPAYFDKFSYERLIDRRAIDRCLKEVLWAELSDTLLGELRPIKGYDVFFDGVQSPKATRKEWRDCLTHFMVMDFAQRFLKESALDEYKEILLFIRSVGAFRFDGPFKMFIYDYPSEIHSSSEFGGRLVLHNMEGPAITYAKGGIYVAEGFEFEERFFTQPESITLAEIEAEKNQEIRRIMTSLMGIGRYLQESGAEVIQMDSVRVMTVGDDDRRMPRALIKAKDGRLFLCGTDGSTKRVYYMPVPRDVTTCQMAHEAIAGPVGQRRVELRTNRWGGTLQLGLDENNCIAQS